MNDKRKYFKNHINEVFIETGSYIGDGIFKALQCGFSKIISIEISEKYHSLCSKRFKNNKNVEIILGDSYKVLPNILKSINCKSTFWLDGHHSCGDTGLGEFWSPLIQELEAIKNHNINEHAIIIDDMDCWEHENPAHGFTTKNILKSLKDINEKYIINHHKDTNVLEAYI